MKKEYYEKFREYLKMLPIDSMNAIGSTILEYDYALSSLAVHVSGSLLFQI